MPIAAGLLLALAGCGSGDKSRTGASGEDSARSSKTARDAEVADVNGGRQPSNTTISTPVPQGTNHNGQFDADVLHFMHQGSGFFPMAVVRALNDSITRRPFLENLERFGLVPGKQSDKWNKDSFPVGIVTNTVAIEDRDVEMFGFTCAACHTSDLRCNGHTLRVDGGSGLFFVDDLGDQIGNSLEATLKDPDEFFAFLRRYRKHSKLDDWLLSRFEKVADLRKDSELGDALATHLNETSQFLLNEIHHAREDDSARPPLLHEQLSDLLKKKRVGGGLLKGVAENAVERTLGGLFSQIDDAIAEIRYRVKFLKMRAWLQKPGNRLPAGYGRADDFGTARVELFGSWHEMNMLPVDAPVSVPPLWNVDRFAWLHWNANTNSVIQRSIGEAIGVGASFNAESLETTVAIANQMQIEEQIQRLTTPVWPDEFGKPDRARIDRGKDIYAGRCAKCHDPTEEDDRGLLVFHLSTLDESGTDPRDAQNFDRPVFKKDGSHVGFAASIADLLEQLQQKARELMTAKDRALMARLEAKRKPKWRDTRTETGGPVYPARPLDGIWASAPYLHNGSVPTLYHLLLPEEKRPPQFVIGLQDFDPHDVGFEWDPKKYPTFADPHVPDKRLFLFDTTIDGNRNSGHQYGTDLSEEDRRALIEYLKIHETPGLTRPR
jgi:mono/diheme cytochrome c family protein